MSVISSDALITQLRALVASRLADQSGQPATTPLTLPQSPRFPVVYVASGPVLRYAVHRRLDTYLLMAHYIVRVERVRVPTHVNRPHQELPAIEDWRRFVPRISPVIQRPSIAVVKAGRPSPEEMIAAGADFAARRRALVPAVSQRDLAYAAGLSRGLLAGFEKGTHRLDLLTGQRALSALAALEKR